MTTNKIIKPRWVHDLSRAKELSSGIAEALEEDTVPMANDHTMSQETYNLISELNEIAERYYPDPFSTPLPGWSDDDE